MTSDRTDASDDRPQRPTNEDPTAWRTYWLALGQMWRTEPEIDEERKEELARQRAIRPDPDRGEYPFKGVELSRRDVEWLCDVEWLLEGHEDGRGPVYLPYREILEDVKKRGQGLDLRGASASQKR